MLHGILWHFNQIKQPLVVIQSKSRMHYSPHLVTGNIISGEAVLLVPNLQLVLQLKVDPACMCLY